ncbi:MAG: peptidase M14 [Xanthomonadaceae bacterium]|nr:peptidase M14 [Xanthomonadaceae bacterium]
MHDSTRCGAAIALAAFLSFAPGDSMSDETGWQTLAESTDYARTARYAETMEWARRLADASDQIDYQVFGQSPEGRDLVVLVASSDRAFTPAAARATGKEIVLVQAFIPIFSVDGHERFHPYTRINQNGPEKSGWRATAQNYNLNRDYIKADSPEMRAWLALFNAWLPDLFIDTHNTNGADYQYDFTYGLEMYANAHPALVAWQRDAFYGAIFPALEARGHKLSPYIVLRDGTDPTLGFEVFQSEPRYSTGYTAIQNRPALLVEMHMLKDYRTRVVGTYAILLESLRYLNAHPGTLRRAVDAADAATETRYRDGGEYPLALAIGEGSRPFEFLGYEFTRTDSEVSGGTWIQYDPDRPRTFTVPIYDEVTVRHAAPTPSAYIIPAALTDVIERLDWHGIEYRRLDAPRDIEVKTWLFRSVEWAARPFENRHMVEDFNAVPIERNMHFPAGSVMVSLDQRRANVIMHMLEPHAPDSLLRWGLLDHIFESKEHAEPRVLERIAREMMAEDPALREAFERRVADDPEFAANPRARLHWFYQRTPYYDERLNVYPIGRLMEE